MSADIYTDGNIMPDSWECPSQVAKMRDEVEDSLLDGIELDDLKFQSGRLPTVVLRIRGELSEWQVQERDGKYRAAISIGRIPSLGQLHHRKLQLETERLEIENRRQRRLSHSPDATKGHKRDQFPEWAVVAVGAYMFFSGFLLFHIISTHY